MKYSKDVERAIKESKEIAIEIQSKTIRPEHLFLALIENEDSMAYLTLKDMKLNIDAIKQTLKDWSNAVQGQIGLSKLRSNSVISLDLETDKILKYAIKSFISVLS